MQKAEQDLRAVECETERLESVKTDLPKFKAAVKKLQLSDLRHDIAPYQDQNHCAAIDNYVDRYLPLVV